MEEKAISGQKRLYSYAQGAGKDIVLLHGWGMHSDIWNSVLPELVAKYRVTMVDLPGHGRSPPASFTLDSLVEELDEIIPSDSVLVGWSLGAMVAQKLVLSSQALSPEKFVGLILVAGTPRFVDAEDWPHATRREVFSQFSRDLEQDYQSTLKRFIYLQSKGGERSGDTRRQLQESMMHGPQPDPDSLKYGLDILESTDLRKDLDKIRCPVQLVMGDRDTLVPIGAGNDIAKLLRNVQLKTITGAGHAPFISHPKEFVKSVISFITTD